MKIKITIENEDGKTKVFEGKRAELLSSAIESLWEDYCRREKELSQAFEDFLTTLRGW